MTDVRREPNWDIVYQLPVSLVVSGQAIPNGDRPWREVRGGDWDLQAKPMANDFRFVGIGQMLAGVPLRETAIGKWRLEAERDGRPLPGYVSADQYLEEKEASLTAMAEEVRLTGRLGTNAAYRAKAGDGKLVDEIALAIDRYGRYQLVDGWHRLSLLRHLGATHFWGRVVARHAEWEGFKERVADTFENWWWKKRYKTYSPIPHPDFEGWQYAWSMDRMTMVSETSRGPGSLLDLGGMVGANSLALASEGYRPHMVEISPRLVKIARVLFGASPYNVRLTEGSFFDLPDEDLHVDTVLALNLFHHPAKTEEGFSALLSFLRRLRCRELFFQSARHRESQMKKAHRDMSVDQWSELILEHVPGLRYSEVIGIEHGRPVVRFSEEP